MRVVTLVYPHANDKNSTTTIKLKYIFEVAYIAYKIYMNKRKFMSLCVCVTFYDDNEDYRT